MSSLSLSPKPSYATPGRRTSRGGGASTPSTTTPKKQRKIPSILLFIVGFGCFLLWQGTRQTYPSDYHPGSSSSYAHFDLPSVLTSYAAGDDPAAAASSNNGPLGVPLGEAVALKNTKSVSRQINTRRKDKKLGGDGDSAHLGGFLMGKTGIDLHGISPTVWKKMVTQYNIKSVLDLGCGRAFATSWFQTHGIRTRGVDGSSDALRQSALPADLREQVLVEHDYSLGPWWPGETFDAVWSVEFMEHVGLNVMQNYLPTLRKAALIFVTTSRWGGWHHVEVHNDEWWIRKFEAFGFRYSQELTNEVRLWATHEKKEHKAIPFVPGQTYNAQEIWLSMKVFVNPVVASLPAHHHLFYEPGCFQGRDQGEVVHRECGENEESHLPESYRPIALTPEMDKTWESMVQAALQPSTQSKLMDLVTPKKIIETAVDRPSAAGLSTAGLSEQELPEILQRIQNRNYTNMPLIPVLSWPYVSTGIKTAEHLHLEQNGVLESQVLRLSKDLFDVDPNIVWVGDTGSGAGWNFWCGEFMKVVNETMTFRISQGLPPRWPIFIVDFTDHASLQRCRDIEALMGRDYVRYSTRSLGKGRKWVDDIDWVNFGTLLNTTTEDGLQYRHTPLVARTDTIESLKQILAKRGLDLTHPIERLSRSTDAIHLWPINSTKVNQQYANLRTRVSEILADLGNDKSLNLTTFVGLAGKPLKEGRRGVEDNYIEMMLDSKIVLVTQRDFWEDHYRLMEALVSGACVFSDFMHGLPAGLENGTSIVEFTSEKDLKDLLLYYLRHDEERIEIGRKGREVAMQRHRTWHRIEEVIFGEILTTCESKGQGGNCPYIVHGDEKR